MSEKVYDFALLPFIIYILMYIYNSVALPRYCMVMFRIGRRGGKGFGWFGIVSLPCESL